MFHFVFVQLNYLLEKCPVVDFLYISSGRNSLEIDNNTLFYLLNSNIEKIQLSHKMVFDGEFLLSNLHMLSDGCVINIKSFNDVGIEERFLKLPMNLRDKLYVGNFNNAIFEIIYKCQRTKRVDLDMYCKYRDFFDHLNEFDIAINNVGCLNL